MLVHINYTEFKEVGRGCRFHIDIKNGTPEYIKIMLAPDVYLAVNLSNGDLVKFNDDKKVIASIDWFPQVLEASESKKVKKNPHFLLSRLCGFG